MTYLALAAIAKAGRSNQTDLEQLLKEDGMGLAQVQQSSELIEASQDDCYEDIEDDLFDHPYFEWDDIDNMDWDASDYVDFLTNNYDVLGMCESMQ